MYWEKIDDFNDLKKMKVSQLPLYAAEMRQKIIEAVEANGGHLASNLGSVDFTIAMHYVYDCERDSFVFDVGHQTYAHKILTGRKNGMEKLRQNGGISGFPSATESKYDLFTTGHSSSSLSYAAGLSKAKRLAGDDSRTIAVIGDGAFTGGMVYEALNDIGDNELPLIIILNDNEMSIAENVGAISGYFSKLRLSKGYARLKSDVKKNFACITGNRDIKAVENAKTRFKSLFLANRLFENFGISYYGPFDGHDIPQMCRIFETMKTKNKPILIHLVTKKGKGYVAAEKQPDKYHGVSVGDGGVSLSKVAGEVLAKMADNDERVVAVTAAMSGGTGLEIFAQKHKSRYYDVGIAEQHAVTMCAGLARLGKKPYFAVYSTFLQRAFDQVISDVCLNNLPVTFLIDRAGAVGSDGVTHQGVFDLSYLNLIPNITVLTPKDDTELGEMLRWSLSFDAPLAIRYPKSFGADFPKFYSENRLSMSDIVLNWERLNDEKSNVYILAAGVRAIEVATECNGANVINARCVKPLDTRFLDSINRSGNLIITIEDNVAAGGFGEAVLSYCGGNAAKVVVFAHSNVFCDNRSVSGAFCDSGITSKNINKIIAEFLRGD